MRIENEWREFEALSLVMSCRRVVRRRIVIYVERSWHVRRRVKHGVATRKHAQLRDSTGSYEIRAWRCACTGSYRLAKTNKGTVADSMNFENKPRRYRQIAAAHRQNCPALTPQPLSAPTPVCWQMG